MENKVPYCGLMKHSWYHQRFTPPLNPLHTGEHLAERVEGTFKPPTAVTLARQPISKTALSLFALLLLASFALRMWHLDTESIWHDEGWSIRAFRGPFTTPDDNTPFVYYLTGHVLWRLGGGETPLALRYISVLMGTLTVALAIRIGRRWFGIGAGLASGVLVATSPLLWEYSQEVRAYVVVPLVALAMLAGAGAILRRRHGVGAPAIPQRLWVFIFMVECVGLYTHNLAVPLVAWLNVALGMVWLRRRDWRRIVTWAVLQVVLVAAYVPWLLTQSPSGTPLNTPPEPGMALVRDTWYSYFLPVLPQLRDTVSGQHPAARVVIDLLGMVGVVIVIVASGVLIPSPSPTRGEGRLRARYASPLPDGAAIQWWLLVSHMVLVPVFTTLLMLAAHIDFHPRYYIAAVPATLLLLVGGVYIIVLRMARKHHAVSLREGDTSDDVHRGVLVGSPYRRCVFTSVAYGFVTGIGLWIGFQSLHQITSTRAYQHDDFRGLAEYYATLPEDAVILIPFDAERALQDYFVQVLDIQAQVVNVPLYSDDAALLEILNGLAHDGGRHVEFLTWFQLPADARGMYPCLLTAMSTGDMLHAPRFYFGLSTQRFDIASKELQPLAIEPAYGEIALEDAAYGTSRAGTCVRTTWTLNRPVLDNVNVAAAVLNPIGGQLTRSDAEIANVENVGTSRWDTGETGSAYNLLLPPAGVPMAEYDLTLNVYSASQPSGFDLLDESGNPAGKVYTADGALAMLGPPVPPEEVPATPVLAADNAGADHVVQTGIPLDVTLRVPQPDFTVRLVGDGWSFEQIVDTRQPAALSWHRFIVPPGTSGEAILLVDGVDVAQYTVVDVPRLFDLPEVDVPVDVVFPGAGTLVGVNLPELPLSSQTPPDITLVWRAEATTELPYTVFMQLLSPGGVVVAQSDSQPSGGTRPTTGWVEGEYILDTHTLRFNVVDHTGSVTLVAGFYNPENFRRVRTLVGNDYARIEAEISVQD